MGQKRTIIVVVLFLLAVALAWPSISEFFAVDRCLDAGGSFNYATGLCDLTVNHPYVGIWERHAPSLAGAIVSAVVGAGAWLLPWVIVRSSTRLHSNRAAHPEPLKQRTLLRSSSRRPGGRER